MSDGVLPDLVGRVVLRSTADTPAVRLSVRDRVGRVRLHVAGSSAHEILIVRRLVGQVDDGGPAGPMAAGGLEASLRRQLADARRDAVRLDGRPVPPGASAVVARDLAQLLGQYVVDVKDGSGGRWWWQALAGRLGRGSAATVLNAHPQEAPHAIADVVRRGRGDVFERSEEGAVRDLLLGLAAEYQAPRLAAVVRELEPDRSQSHRGQAYRSRSGSAVRRGSPLVELLLTAAVQLARDPAGARGEDFARFASTVLGVPAEGGKIPEHGDGSAVPTVEAPPDITDPADRGARTLRPAGRNLPDEDGTGKARDGDPGRVVEAPPGDGNGANGASLATEHRNGGSGREDAPADQLSRAHQPDAGREARPPSEFPWPAPEPTAPGPPDPPEPAGTVSELGGVFFLVRLCSELGLPEVFERDWRLASTLGAWGTLDLLARSLLPGGEGWEHDPVWEMLRDLGAGSPFERFPAMPARIVADVPVGWPRPDADAAEACPLLDRTLAAAANQGARRWLHLVRPVAAGLLVERLGVPADWLATALLQRGARVMYDRTHVDVAFPLAAASVAVRRAGLDRDPGWAPELARVITFRFDDAAFEGAAP